MSSLCLCVSVVNSSWLGPAVIRHLSLCLLLAAPALAAEGKEIFAQKCAACHGPDGKGKTKMGEKLGVKDLTALDSSVDVQKTIEEGKPPKMTAYKGKLSDDEIKAVAAYVKGGLK
jgi:cytochrome c6